MVEHAPVVTEQAQLRACIAAVQTDHHAPLRASRLLAQQLADAHVQDLRQIAEIIQIRRRLGVFPLGHRLRRDEQPPRDLRLRHMLAQAEFMDIAREGLQVKHTPAPFRSFLLSIIVRIAQSASNRRGNRKIFQL